MGLYLGIVYLLFLGLVISTALAILIGVTLMITGIVKNRQNLQEDNESKAPKIMQIVGTVLLIIGVLLFIFTVVFTKGSGLGYFL